MMDELVSCGAGSIDKSLQSEVFRGRKSAKSKDLMRSDRDWDRSLSLTIS